MKYKPPRPQTELIHGLYPGYQGSQCLWTYLSGGLYTLLCVFLFLSFHLPNCSSKSTEESPKAQDLEFTKVLFIKHQQDIGLL